MSRLVAAAVVAAGAVLLARVLRRRWDAALVRATLAVLVGGTVVLDVLLRPAPAAALVPSFGPPHVLATLFGSRCGLFFFNPVLWLGVLGLWAEVRDREPGARLLLAAALGVVGGLSCWAPAPPPAAVALLPPLLATGMARSLAALRAWTRRSPAAPLWASGIALGAWNLAFMQQYASGMIARDFPLPFAEVAGNTAGLVARAAGTPTAWPANWIFALRHGVGPERFDAAVGKDVPRAAGGAAVLDVGRAELDQALLLEGWSVRHPCGPEVCRAIDGRARALLPFAGGPATVRVRASGRGWLRVGAAPPQPLREPAADLDFVLGPFSRGLRAVPLAVGAGGEALVDRIEVREER